MATGPTYLDLDAVQDETTYVIKLNGVDHPLKPISVRDFVKNTKIIQNLPKNLDTEQEMGFLVDMLSRAFPTIKSEDLWELPLTTLNKIMEFAQSKNGADKVAGEAQAEAEANPPVAAS